MGHLRKTIYGKPYKYSHWPNEEVGKLIDTYEKSTNEELLKAFPDRSILSIYKKAYSLGLRKNAEIEFENRSLSKRGEKAYNWNGGKQKTSNGYIQILMPTHHRAHKDGYVLEHILMFEQATGQKVPKDYCVHHINGIKNDNRPENLIMMKKAEHTKLHHTEVKRSEETRGKISKKLTKIVSYMGSAIPLNELAEKLSIPKTTLAYRLKAGWSDDELSLAPNRSNRKLKEIRK